MMTKTYKTCKQASQLRATFVFAASHRDFNVDALAAQSVVRTLLVQGSPVRDLQRDFSFWSSASPIIVKGLSLFPTRTREDLLAPSSRTGPLAVSALSQHHLHPSVYTQKPCNEAGFVSLEGQPLRQTTAAIGAASTLRFPAEEPLDGLWAVRAQPQ
eukprot:Selendium_serpulae@DN6397_c0_g2_i1.p1